MDVMSTVCKRLCAQNLDLHLYMHFDIQTGSENGLGHCGPERCHISHKLV